MAKKKEKKWIDVDTCDAKLWLHWSNDDEEFEETVALPEWIWNYIDQHVTELVEQKNEEEDRVPNE